MTILRKLFGRKKATTGRESELGPTSTDTAYKGQAGEMTTGAEEKPAASTNIQSPPPTGDAYVDSCFQFDFEELDESREWRQMDDLAEIPRLAASGRNEEALAVIEEALARYPDYDFLYAWRGYVQGKLGRREEQRKTYLEGIQKSRSKAGLCDYLGMWAFESDQLTEAVRWWLKSCAIQLSRKRMEYAQPFLRLAYIAEGLGLTACQPALLEQVDRINYVRLNAEGERLCWRLAVSQGNDAIKRAISLLCDFYLWGISEIEVEGGRKRETGARSFEGTEAFLRTFRKHLQGIKAKAPVLTPFLDQYFSETQLADLAPAAEEEMRRTLSDGDEHGIALSQPPVYYQICTLMGTVEQARDWFAHRYGGYTKVLERLWNSPLFHTSGCSVLCHIVYGNTGEEAWVHMAIYPVRESAPVDNLVTPIEFLSADERRMFGL